MSGRLTQSHGKAVDSLRTYCTKYSALYDAAGRPVMAAKLLVEYIDHVTMRGARAEEALRRASVANKATVNPQLLSVIDRVEHAVSVDEDNSSSAGQIASATGLKLKVVGVKLAQLCKQGRVRRVGVGRYARDPVEIAVTHIPELP